MDSTNSWSIQHCKEFRDDHLPLLVICDSQSAGRGRQGRSWHADAGALTFSILDSALRLGLALEHVPKLALVAGLSVAEAIDDLIPPYSARIKWPNDVLVAGKKVAGVLIENVPQTQSNRVVVGIGVNVSTNFLIATEEVRERATSISEISGRHLDLGSVLVSVLERYHENLKTLAGLENSRPATGDQPKKCQLGFSELLSSLRNRCFLTGQKIRMNQGGQQILGRCEGLGNDGELLLATDRGVVAITSGEIVRIEGVS